MKALFKSQNGGNGSPNIENDGGSPNRSPTQRNGATQKSVSPTGSGRREGKLTEGFAAFIRDQEAGDRYMSKDFWNSLEDEVEGLRDLLEQKGETDDTADHDGTVFTPVRSSHTPNFVFDAHSPSLSRDTFKQASHADRTEIMRIYMRHVHPCCPVLHEPIIREHLLNTTEMLDESGDHFKFESLDALSFSICFAAVSSITPEDCREFLGEEKDILLPRFKSATEMALNAADFLNSMELVTLTSFVIYLVCAGALQIYNSADCVRRWLRGFRIAHAPYGHWLVSLYESLNP